MTDQLRKIGKVYEIGGKQCRLVEDGANYDDACFECMFRGKPCDNLESSQDYGCCRGENTDEKPAHWEPAECDVSGAPQKAAKRKVVQIAAQPAAEYEDSVLWSLCNDGTVWYSEYSMAGWERMPDIPQPETGQMCGGADE